METISDRETLGDAAKRKFGETVRAQRLARPMTQDGLAQKMTAFGIPMTQTTVAKIERGDRPTPISEAAVLAHVFGVSLGDLLPVDEATEKLAHQASVDAELQRLSAVISRQRSILRDATYRSLAARHELKRLMESEGIEIPDQGRYPADKENERLNTALFHLDDRNGPTEVIWLASHRFNLYIETMGSDEDSISAHEVRRVMKEIHGGIDPEDA